MAVWIQLENGKIKEYRTSFGMGTIDPPSEGEHKTLCGMKWKGKPAINEECDHLDCAISASRDGFREYGQLALFIATFWVFIGLVWHDFRWFGLLFGILSGLLLGLASLNYYHKNSELKEFRDHRMVNRIKANKL